MSIFYIEKSKRNMLKPLVDNWNETMILSCIQGHMGEAYTDSLYKPLSVQMVVADFCFFAGKPNEELVRNKDAIKSKFIIMVSDSNEWNELIEKVYPKNSKKVIRYAIKKEYDIFDKEKLQDVVSKLDSQYELKLFDSSIYKDALSEEWSKDLCSHYIDDKDFVNHGIGVAVYHKGKIVAGASSYTVYNDGIEIEVDTNIEYRRRGLAYIACAKLILECLGRNLYPSWDAQNKGSVALAEKLGYHFDHEYIAYEVVWR